MMRLTLPWNGTSDAADEENQKREAAIDSPATVSAETLNDSELCDTESMPAIFLSPGRHRARSASPLSFFLGGGVDHPTWCSPSRIVIPTLSPIKDDEDDYEIKSQEIIEDDVFIKAIPLDLSFDSTQGMGTISLGTSEQPVLGRPAFVSATVFDAGRNSNGIGLTIQCIGGRLLVTKIRNDGLLSDSPIRVGDELVSINGKSCNIIMTGEQATRILNHLDGIVSVVVATGRDSGYIESMIMKPNGWSRKTGLGLQVVEGKLQILKIDPNGLWIHSLLSEGNHVLSVNACPSSQLDGLAAVTLVNASDTRVTIVAKTTQETNVVVEEQEQISSTGLRVFNESVAGLQSASRISSIDFLGPCAQKAWSPAKIAHVSANVLASIAPVVVCLGLGLGIYIVMLSVLCSLLIVNLPWLGWKDRHGSLCSLGQLVSTLLVLVCCAILLPVYYSGSLLQSLFLSIGIALPSTLLANLPMHFTDDGIEHFAVSHPHVNGLANEDEGSCSLEGEMPV